MVLPGINGEGIIRISLPGMCLEGGDKVGVGWAMATDVWVWAWACLIYRCNQDTFQSGYTLVEETVTQTELAKCKIPTGFTLVFPRSG